MSRTVDAVLWDVGGVFMPSPFSHMRSLGPELGMDGDRVVEQEADSLNDGQPETEALGAVPFLVRDLVELLENKP